MDEKHKRYVSPFSTRYASEEMLYIFSEEKKFRTWRKLWIALAKAEKQAGLDITDEQIEELEKHACDINYEVAKEREKQVRHDVMSHVYAYGEQCPHAKGIIHLGATSCYVGDNTDIIIMHEALELIIKKLVCVVSNLSKFALKYKSLPCLAYTHLQPAQLTTVGKRACLWTYDFCLDYKNLVRTKVDLCLLGLKGTTGTQASFMELFNGDEKLIKQVEKNIASELGFEKIVPVSGQTYTRKFDFDVLSTLAGVAQSASKMCTDIRLLSSYKELEEPFEENQIGSSAMPYKRNPMRSERVCSIARYVICDLLNPAITASCQMFERTLDDSANKRISVAEAFLGIDSILNILINISDGLVVYPKVIEGRVMAELPFMATENILMKAVKKGGDRQALHEIIRQHSQKAGDKVKKDGEKNDLISRIESDSRFNLSAEEIKECINPSDFIGAAPSQVQEFYEDVAFPIIDANKQSINIKSELSV